MSEPLWDDKRIDAKIESIEEVWIEESFAAVARHIRDDYERRIAELEGQLAQRSEWEPVTSGEIECVCNDPSCEHVAWVDGSTIDITDGEHSVSMTLPDGYALYRRASSDA